MRFLPAIASARSHAVSWTTDQARARLSQPRHTWAELLRDGAETKLYLDYDHVLPDRPRDAPPLTEEDEDVSTHREMVVERLCHILDLLQALARSKGVDEDAVQKMRFVIASRHGWCATKDCWKISYRPFLLGIRIQYDQIRIILGLTGQMPDMGEDSFWDLSVYKSSEQLLACINGIKSAADTRMLAACMTVPGTDGGPDFEVLDYVAQVVEQDWLCLTAPPEHVEGYWKGQAERRARVAQASANSSRTPSRAQSAVPQHVLRLLVLGLAPDRADDRKLWIETVWAIRAVSAGNGYEEAGEGLAQDFSRLCVAKYDSRAVSKAYSEGRPGGASGVGLGSLLFWYKEDNADRPRLFRELQAMLRASPLSSAVSVAGATQAVGACLDTDIVSDIWCYGEALVKLDNTRTACVHSSTQAFKRPAYAFREDGENEALRLRPVYAPRARVAPAVASANAEAERQLLKHMQDKCPNLFDKLQVDGFHAEALANKNTQLTEDSTSFAATLIYPQCSIVVAGEQQPLCSLADNIKINNMQLLNSKISNDMEFTLSRTIRDSLDITQMDGSDAVTGEVSVTVYNAFSRELIKPLLKIRGKSTTVNKIQALHLYNQIAEQAAKHVMEKLGPCANMLFSIGTLNINTQINVGALAVADKHSEFVQNRIMLEAAGLRGGFRKWAGMVYEPVTGCPCAYKIRCTYEEFINAELEGDEAFKSNPRRVKDLVMFMTDFGMIEMAWFKPDLDLVSFSNGVLQLASGVFNPYLGMDMSEVGGLAKKVARHHISYPYTGCVDTPLLNIILNFQFEPEVSELLLALIGRCFFKVGQKDGWQVMPFLVGVGGTGKSLVLNIVDALFAAGKVGNLAAKREEVFGMANLVTKELVLGRDMPAKMSASLPQEIMQSMTAGEEMEIPRKGLEALQVRWTAPVIMAGNHMPDYTNTGNNIGRRMVSIRFDNVVAVTQDDLQNRILEGELPNIVCRALTAYSSYLGRVKASGGFWKAVPPVVLEWRSKLSASTNRVEAFFAMDDETRGCSIKHEPGAMTWLTDFKKMYEAKRDDVVVKFVEDPAVFQTHGFRLSLTRASMCKSCKRVATADCCNEAGRDNKIMKTIIHNMVLQRVPQQVKYISTCDGTSSMAERAFKSGVEHLTGLAFIKVRCDGILSLAGNPLELDMYHTSPTLTVAIEYNGYQHYQFPNNYHTTLTEFTKGQVHDGIKVRRCKELGLALIVIRGSNLDDELAQFKTDWTELGFQVQSRAYKSLVRV